MREALEKEIIAGILVNEKNFPKVAQILSAEDFLFYRSHFIELEKIWKSDHQKNLFLELAKVFKASEIVELTNSFYSRPIGLACKELKTFVVSDRIQTILHNAVENFPLDNVNEYIADLQQQLVHNSLSDTNEDPAIESVIKEFTEEQLAYQEKYQNGQELIGISCGFPKLDNLIDGLRKGHFWVIGGYTSMGKTFGGLNIATHLIKNKKRVVIYTLEMSRVDVLSRSLGILIQDSPRAIAKGFVDQTKITPVLKEIEDSNLAIISQQRDLSQILLSMHEEHLRRPVDLFIVDYIGLVSVKGVKSEYEQMKAVSLELQNAAKRFQTPLIALSQVNNDAAKAGDQMVMGFKGAGDIAAAADFAIELVSGEESNVELKTKMQKGEPVKIKWIVKKNRHGSVGYDMMEFTGKTGVFKELDESNF